MSSAEFSSEPGPTLPPRTNQFSTSAWEPLNALSGSLLFTSDAVYFWGKYTFRIKMILIILGGINAALLGRRVFREAAGVPAPPPAASTKWIAFSSLVFWFGAVIAGRLIAYAP